MPHPYRLEVKAGYLFILRKPLCPSCILCWNVSPVVPLMKQIVPIFLALIPFAAVVGACVTVP
ncbi:hypothetical protein SPMU_10050 [Sphingomonas mucosissima]|uniref:Uncharacterized protein n=1 Tax=Sphingomonas mucosissima TaxID=370959 RepID=A0A245ZSF2_9SPHN|nr:hypothetical protein SPMU_10050 [Sphingomonas mucosissima]